jgi:cell division protein FtsZ
MAERGNALLGCGVGTGPNRAIEAAQNAVSSPLLEEVSILGAEALLINVQGGADMGLHEAAEATQFIADRVGDDADVFWGAVLDPSLGEEMRVTIIATGFSKSSTSVEPVAAQAKEAPRDLVREMPREPMREPVREPAREFLRDAPPDAGRELPRPEPVEIRRPRVEPSPVSLRAPMPSPSMPATRPEPTSPPEPAMPPSREYAPDYGPIGGGRWDQEPSMESELFLPEAEEGAVGSTVAYDWPAGTRASREEERLEPAPEAPRASRERWWDLERLVSSPRRQAEAKLGRSPLDKPTFMRKRMED